MDVGRFKAHWVSVDADGSLSQARRRGDPEALASVRDGFGVTADVSRKSWFQASASAVWHAKEAEMGRKMKVLREEALEQLRGGIPCLPRVCKEEVGFYDASADVKKLYLASFPGSGNTWLRSVVRAGSRKYTGSLYNDKKLANNQGFAGELLASVDPTTSVVKSHYPMWKLGAPLKQPRFSGAVYIVRAPFDAILAELNRIYSGEKHRGVASDEDLGGDGRARTPALAAHFLQSVAYWEGLNGYSPVTGKAIAHEGHGSKDYDGTRVRHMKGSFAYDVRPMKNGKGFPVLTLFYEDFRRDFVGALASLFAFLKLHLGPQNPTVYESIVCSLRKQRSFQRVKRNADQQNPFLDMAAELCESFAFVWNEDKWGPCLGRLQRERADVHIDEAWKNIVIPAQLCDA